MNWIEINLPFQLHDLKYDGEPAPDFSEQEKKLFGITFAESEELSRNGLIKFFSVEDRIKEQLNQFKLDFPFAEADEIDQFNEYLFRAAEENDKAVRDVRFHRTLSPKYYKWLEQQPEYQAWDKRESAAYERAWIEHKQKSFCGRGLNVPGTLIELEDGSIHLIGSINTNGGVCSDCVAFDESMIVKRYAVILDFNSMVKTNE